MNFEVAANVGGLRKSAKSRTSNHSLIRWGGLALIALAELTWLAIWVEVPATGFLSVFKGFPSNGHALFQDDLGLSLR